MIDHCLAEFVAKEVVPGKQVGLAWLYCQSAKKKTQTMRGLIRSLVRQLCHSAYKGGPQIRRDCFVTIKEFKKTYKYPTLEDYSKFLKKLVEKCTSCFIIIDAFDECQTMDPEGRTADEMIEELSKLNVQLLVTSRSSIVPIRDWENISIQPDRDDVEKYIDWRLDHSPLRFKSLLKETDGLRRQIIDDVIKKYGEV
jgi:hypothetical protein